MSRADLATIQDGRRKRIRLAKMRFQGASVSSHSSAQIFATVVALMELLSSAACTPTCSQSERVTPSAQLPYSQAS